MSKDSKTVFIGRKPTMDYVLAVMSHFNSSDNNEVVIKARGRAISTAVDVAEIVNKRFLKDLNVEDVKIDTEEIPEIQIADEQKEKPKDIPPPSLVVKEKTDEVTEEKAPISSFDLREENVPSDIIDLMKLSPNADQTVKDIALNVRRAIYVDQIHKDKLRSITIEKYDWKNISTKLALDLNQLTKK